VDPSKIGFRWFELPGGDLNAGETYKEAAIREFAEEATNSKATGLRNILALIETTEKDLLLDQNHPTLFHKLFIMNLSEANWTEMKKTRKRKNQEIVECCCIDFARSNENLIFLN